MLFFLRLLRHAFVFVLLPALAGAAMYELYVRYRLVKRINEHFAHAHFWVQNQTLAQMEPDRFFGRKSEMSSFWPIKVNATFDVSVIPVSLDRPAMNFSVRSNNLGFLSDFPYAFEREPGLPEFRIVVLGESFTGPTTATYQWVDTLQELLNSNEALVRAVGGRRFRTYNHGIVGGGFHTFWMEFDNAGRRFDPDLVLVNFLEVDFPRGPTAHMTDEGRMIEHAAGHLQKLAAEAKDLVLTAMPLHEDLVHFDRPLPRSTRLQSALPSMSIIDMRRHMPRAGSHRIADDWTNVPYDAHYSDRGGEIYARSLAKVLARHIAGLEIDFSAVRTRYSDEVLRPGKPRTREIQNAAARLYVQ